MKIDGYSCSDRHCKNRWCWSPGEYESHAQGAAGRIMTGSRSKQCLERAYRGCPVPVPNPGDLPPWEIPETNDTNEQ